jgi:hypothetical protein
MRPFVLGTALAAASLFYPTALHAQKINSSYTDISAKACHDENPSEGYDYSLACPGPGGWTLRAESVDREARLALVDPQGSRFSLNYADLIDFDHSVLGPKAEWRYAVTDGRKIPLALIFRLQLKRGGPPEDSRSVLVVAKFPNASSPLCVTDIIAPGRGQNESARRAADAAAGKSCLSSSRQ